jgi:PleD family two-component response regulator
MVKAEPAPLRKAPVARAKPGSVKRRRKASQPKVNPALDQTEIAEMIDQIRKEVGEHVGRTSELKADLEQVATTTLLALRQVEELRNIVESQRAELPGETAGPAAGERYPASPKQRDGLSAALPAPDNGRKKILVVDDDSTTVKIISYFLQKEDYRVSTSLSGVDGLKKAFQESPDLIILDVMMPDLNGFQFLSIYRKDEGNAHIPIVILSSLSEEADVLKGLEIGAVDYITKPFSPQVLIAKIKKNLNSGP